ncbi:DMT family transporter [Enterococcus faecium]|uniref:DMT family transporter n=1 Tax=Enterococcus faecium TaxID=1352 RepID=UPI0023DC525C|nr:SMR family transporter [Enterococcus faecium]
MFLWLKTLYRKRAVTWPFIFYTIIWTLSIGMIASFYFLSKAIKSLPMSLSYPIWTGIGAVGSVIIGVVLFHDKLNLSTWFFVGMLLISIIGIKITSGH